MSFGGDSYFNQESENPGSPNVEKLSLENDLNTPTTITNNPKTQSNTSLNRDGESSQPPTTVARSYTKIQSDKETASDLTMSISNSHTKDGQSFARYIEKISSKPSEILQNSETNPTNLFNINSIGSSEIETINEFSKLEHVRQRSRTPTRKSTKKKTQPTKNDQDNFKKSKTNDGKEEAQESESRECDKSEDQKTNFVSCLEAWEMQQKSVYSNQSS
jgi:hypothetical protein